MSYTKGKLESKEETDGHFGIYPTDGENCIAVVWNDEESAEANAAELVRRWNSHDALLEALDQIARRKFLVDCDVDERNQMVSVAKATIAAANKS